MEEKNKSPIYEEAEKDYIKGMKYKDIADKYNVSINTVKSWKTRYKWIKGVQKSTHTKSKKVCTQKEELKNNKKGANDNIAVEVKEVVDNKELNENQKLFCIYYSKSFNQTKAYQKAYGCDYFTAAVSANRLLKNDKIKAMVDQLTQITMNKEVLKRGLLQKYIDIAFADIKDYMEFGNEEVEGKYGTYTASYINIKDCNEVDGTLISEISQGKDGIKVKLLDKMKAMDFLSKHCNLLSDEEKTKLDIEYKKLQNSKLEKEIAHNSKDTNKEPVRIVDDI